MMAIAGRKGTARFGSVVVSIRSAAAIAKSDLGLAGIGASNRRAIGGDGLIWGWGVGTGHT